MRLRKAWIVASKELAEFKSNKYIVFTLLFVPLVFAIIVPFATITPLATLGPTDQPLPLNPTITGSRQGEIIVGEVLANVSIEDSVIVESVIVGSRIQNSTLRGVTVEASILEGVSLKDSIVLRSNLIDSKDVETTNLVDTAVLGSPGKEFINVILMILDSFLMFFIVIPAAIPAVIASYSFVGEKVNRSLEPLLATPTTDGELLLGKSISIFLPTMAVTWLAAVLFILLTNRLVAPILGYGPLPTIPWIVGIFLLAPLFCTLSITSNVLISSRVSDVRASQQLGTLVILPALALFISSMMGVLALGLFELLIFAVLILLVDLGMGYLALKVFRREEILVSWK
ncbi:MAG: hypothetical protein V3U52_03485 [Thermoplasmata archaeon]